VKYVLAVLAAIALAGIGALVWWVGIQGMTPLDPALLEEFERAERENVSSGEYGHYRFE
jgi:uncharacterized membrane protein YfbV (UPF0208 family)